MIRTAAVVVTALVVVSAGAASPAAPCGGADWAQFRGDTCGTRAVSAAASPAASAVAGTKLIWNARLSAPAGNPVVSGGRVFVVTGRLHARLHALDAATGRRLWQAIAGLGELYSPLADGDVLLRLSNADALRRYDPASGRVLWRRDPPWSEGFLAEPLLAGGLILEQSESLSAVDERTGVERWHVAATCFRCTPAVSDGRVYVADDQGLHALDLQTGATIWDAKTTASAGTRTSPVVDGATVLAVTLAYAKPTWTYYAEAFRSSDGHPLWHTKLAGTNGFDPAVLPAAGGGLFLVPVTDGNLYAVDERTGSVRWKAQVGDTDSSPAIANGVVWIVDGSSRLHAFSLQDGSSLWSGPAMQTMQNMPTPSPVIDGSLVLVGTLGGHVLAFGVR